MTAAGAYELAEKFLAEKRKIKAMADELGLLAELELGTEKLPTEFIEVINNNLSDLLARWGNKKEVEAKDA